MEAGLIAAMFVCGVIAVTIAGYNAVVSARLNSTSAVLCFSIAGLGFLFGVSGLIAAAIKL